MEQAPIVLSAAIRRWVAVGLSSVVILAVLPSVAVAHTGGTLGGFVSGFQHPIFGPDHLLAMLAVGIWGAQIGGRSIWELPVIFPMIMAFGGMLGVAGVPLPHTELLIALSVLTLGAVIAFAWKPVEWLSVIVVGAFALFHGHAHGVELPNAADPIAYGVGFVLATGLIHIAGILIGLVLGRPYHGLIGRAAGLLIALVGVFFLVTAMGVATA
jgi:urease accessory protein